MDGADFYAYCKRKFKRTDKETEFYEILTDVVMDIKLRYFWEDFKEEAYSAGINSLGDYKISLPSDFGHLIGDVVWQDSSTNSKPLTRVPKWKFDEIYPHPNASDVTKSLPQHYSVYADQLLIGPVPDSVSYLYTINYTTEAATTITSATSSVPFTDNYRWIIRDVVLGEFYMYLDLEDRAEYYRSRGEQGIAKMVANENFNDDSVVAVAFNDL